jgi:putative addiction module component (TIGR02574 family)
MNTQELITEVISLPVEDRALIVDYLLKSLNHGEPAIEKTWAEEAQRRLEELRSGAVQAIPGDVVLNNLRKRFHQEHRISPGSSSRA